MGTLITIERDVKIQFQAHLNMTLMADRVSAVDDRNITPKLKRVGFVNFLGGHDADVAYLVLVDLKLYPLNGGKLGFHAPIILGR